MRHLIIGIIGVGALVASIIFAVRDSKKPEQKEEEQEKEEGGIKKAARKIIKDFKKYYKSILLGVLSVGCFVGIHASKAKEAAMFKTLYSVTKDSYDRYAAKNAELSGKTYAEKVRRKAMCEAGKNEYGLKEAYSTGYGDTIFYEIISRSHIYCSFQRIRDIQNELNLILEKKKFVPLKELYKRASIKLPKRQEWIGTALGWNKKDGNVFFEYYPQVLKNGEKAIVLGFKVAPHYSYM